MLNLASRGISRHYVSDCYVLQSNSKVMVDRLLPSSLGSSDFDPGTGTIDLDLSDRMFFCLIFSLMPLMRKVGFFS